MARTLPAFLSILIGLGLVGCENMKRGLSWFDAWSFEEFGRVWLSRPAILSLKEVYLSLEGSGSAGPVVVEGVIGQVGENGTYLVIEDETGRILVVLTDLATLPNGLESRKGTSLKVLGEVERSAKGAAQLRARAISVSGNSAPVSDKKLL